MKTAQLQNTQQEALRTFQRDLPQLWADRPGEWVAYQGDRRIGFGSSKTQLYQQCLRRGLKPSEFLVLSVEPLSPQEVDVFLDV